MSCSRRDRVRQIVPTVKRFHHGEWKDLWETTVCVARKETDNNVKCNQTHTNRNKSIQTRVVYVEHCAWWVALSKANQAITSDLVPNSDPLNIDHLHLNHPEPTHPDRDPVRVISILCQRSHSLQEYWSSDADTELLDKWFTIPKIFQYFLTQLKNLHASHALCCTTKQTRNT
jgi:hypothetical protein